MNPLVKQCHFQCMQKLKTKDRKLIKKLTSAIVCTVPKSNIQPIKDDFFQFGSFPKHVRPLNFELGALVSQSEARIRITQPLGPIRILQVLDFPPKFSGQTCFGKLSSREKSSLKSIFLNSTSLLKTLQGLEILSLKVKSVTENISFFRNVHGHP